MHTIMIQEKNIKTYFFKLSRDQKYVEKHFIFHLMERLKRYSTQLSPLFFCQI